MIAQPMPLLSSVHRVLYGVGTKRSVAGEPREQICAALGAAADQAFELLEPALGGYLVRLADPHGPGPGTRLSRPGP
jgi:hypothetical protein